MENRDVQIYLEEAATQCRLCTGAALALNNAMDAIRADSRGIPNYERLMFLHGEVFRSIHSLLTHASNISRIFWPPEGRGNTGIRRRERGGILRDAVGLPDDDHVLKTRILRDHLEHFDERLDNWRETSERRNLVQDTIAPQGAIAGIDETDMMRWYDPDQKAFIFRGERFDIQSLFSATERLYGQIRVTLTSLREERR